jgi:hypothetical protein
MSQLHSSDFWNEVLQGHNAVSMSVDEALPRLMANLDPACKGEQIGIQAILETLSRVQLAAKLYLSAQKAKEEDGPWDVAEARAWHDERASGMRGAL